MADKCYICKDSFAGWFGKACRRCKKCGNDFCADCYKNFGWKCPICGGELKQV